MECNNIYSRTVLKNNFEVHVEVLLKNAPLAINLEYNESNVIMTKMELPFNKVLTFRLFHTYILCLNLFLGLPIGFAYRRLIWSAFFCSSFFPFSFGLQTWQIQVPGGCPNTESTVWVGSSIRGHTVHSLETFPLIPRAGENPTSSQWQSITQHKAKIHKKNIGSILCPVK